MKYQDVNARTIDGWCRSGWEWGVPITHEAYAAAQAGEWGVYLTPTKYMPRDWLGDLRGKRILGLASGGGQQIPIFSALGARCTVLDYSQEQCERERMVARREGYDVEVIRADMTEPLPFWGWDLRPGIPPGVQLLRRVGGAHLPGVLPGAQRGRQAPGRVRYRHQLYL